MRVESPVSWSGAIVPVGPHEACGPNNERKAELGLDCLSPDFASGKWVDGLRRGKTCNEGGGTPEGYVCEPKGVSGLELGSVDGDALLMPGVPPATNTAEGMAWINVSR